MQFKFAPIALALSLFAGISSIATVAPAYAQTTTSFIDQLQAALEERPEMVMRALQAAQANQQAAQTAQLASKVKPIADALIKGDPQVAVVGNLAGVPVIEFYDYNCGFCKRFHSETAVPLLKEGKTKLILVHTPILGEGSQRLAELAAAANLQGKFEKAHDFLIEHSARSAAEADALRPALIAAAGLDKIKFDKALIDGSATKQVEHNAKLSQTAGVSGTPMVYANGQAIPGAIPLDALKQVLSQ